jgi:hypothetical protein
MATIIAGGFDVVTQADAAVERLRQAGVRTEDLCTFRVNPAGEHQALPGGGDHAASPGAKDAGKGAGAGAAIGAAAGGATGAVVASQGTEHLVIPAETRLQFTLDAAVTVRP